MNRLRRSRERAEEEFKRHKGKKKEERVKLRDLRTSAAENRMNVPGGLRNTTRLKAQLEVLEQAEQSLAGYAEGARYLLDAARQMRLTECPWCIECTSLDVPAELEVAVAAALGETLDAILLDAR